MVILSRILTLKSIDLLTEIIIIYWSLPPLRKITRYIHEVAMIWSGFGQLQILKFIQQLKAKFNNRIEKMRYVIKSS